MLLVCNPVRTGAANGFVGKAVSVAHVQATATATVRATASWQRRWYVVNSKATPGTENESTSVTINGRQYQTDEWMNSPPHILNAVSKGLHLQKDHPLSITRQIIQSRFPNFRYYNDFDPVVSTTQNFDLLGIPEDHPGRSRTDTYYLNKGTVLRTHTSAHQHDVFKSNRSSGFLIGADVYRRDAVDRSHYPIFHQMEGARLWNITEDHGSLAAAVRKDIEDNIPKHDITVEDPNPTVHPERNPLQTGHNLEVVEAIASHLKRSLENVVVAIFSKAKEASTANGTTAVSAEPLKIRWIEAYFPFTSPSWELEVFWQGEWLELLGCGVVQQKLLNDASASDKIGWAFGIGLERIAMLLYEIPDIRLFWSQDPRFLSQFSENKPTQRFVPFSKHPECYKDVSFWVKSGINNSGGGGTGHEFHENDIMEIVRTNAGDLAEDVRLVDEFTHPKTRRRSYCYRINYRSLERTLTNDEVNTLHSTIIASLVEKLGVEIR